MIELEAFQTLLHDAISDGTAVETRVRYARLVSLLEPEVVPEGYVESQALLNEAIVELVKELPDIQRATAMAELLARGEPEGLWLASVLRAWINSYIELYTLDSIVPASAREDRPIIGTAEDVEGLAPKYQTASMSLAGCCIPVQVESTRFG